MKTILLSLILAGSVSSIALQNPVKEPLPSAPKETVVVKAADVKWGEHPFVPGAKLSVQSGDPAKGAAVLLMKFPTGMTIPAHWHTAAETVTIVSGIALLGGGETVDAAKATEVGPGSYAVIPGKNPHWAIAKEELVISVTLDKAVDFHLCGEKK